MKTRHPERGDGSWGADEREGVFVWMVTWTRIALGTPAASHLCCHFSFLTMICDFIFNPTNHMRCKASVRPRASAKDSMERVQEGAAKVAQAAAVAGVAFQASPAFALVRDATHE